jgi:hypothetical protein
MTPATGVAINLIETPFGDDCSRSNPDLKSREIAEVMMQMAVYAGFPQRSTDCLQRKKYSRSAMGRLNTLIMQSAHNPAHGNQMVRRLRLPG